MSLFGRLFQGWSAADSNAQLRQAALERWAAADGATGLGPAADGLDASGQDYQRTLWRKKLQRILDGLPDSKADWTDFFPDAEALGFDKAWVRGCMIEEFTLLVRRAIADSQVTDAEHRKLDMARDLIGLPDDQAEAIFHQAVGEAEEFFGKSVEGA